jgi:hypothetical protein
VSATTTRKEVVATDVVAFDLRGPVRLQLAKHMYKKAGRRRNATFFGEPVWTKT